MRFYSTQQENLLFFIHSDENRKVKKKSKAKNAKGKYAKGKYADFY